ncbi:response regulator [Sphingomonas gilva]|uniref:histidine kinase n=1 Tax=Sphingomonas gilva TaxID=2305907 RepID=A0A396RRQ8_9SPHN|nr:ATP-binding protein [Sphingomonas gilva]RHW18012.1 response regulator [Sphingomonas gilva]
MAGDLETGEPIASDSMWRRVAAVGVALVGAAALIALILMLGSASRERDRALTLQSHSYEVMILSRSLAGSIARAEATLGRYVISGDKDVGRIYLDEWRRAGSQLDRLAAVTADNRAQHPVIQELRRVYTERGRQLAATALRTNYGQNAQALSTYYEAGMSPIVARINTLLERLITNERALLKKRTSAAEVTTAWTNTVTQVLAIFGVVIALGAVALGWSNVQAFTQRQRARRDAAAAAERAEELETAIAGATVELREANARLQDEARERAAAEAQLRQIQKMEAVGQLTGGIAHDFNNMLAVVVGGLELARRRLHDDSDNAQRHIEAAMEGANRAAALTRRLLAFARAEPLLPEAVRPGDLIGGMRDLLDRTLGERITVTTRDDGADWQVWIDRHQLENAILNLAVNARDAMDGSGRLTIETGRAALSDQEVNEAAGGDYATIAVIDTGCGMAPEVLEHVFEPFFTTKPVGKGTGLGLSQIFGFVRQSGGEIEIKSTPGIGTTVTIYLPRHRGAVAAEPARSDAAPADPAPAPRGGLSVLVVEDDARVLAATMAALDELGHSATACEDPLAAPALIEAEGSAFDLIVSDVVMPGINGPEMIARLRPLHPHLAVLFVTGYAGEVDDAALFGGHAVLRKPFTIAALDRAVGEAMAAASGHHGDRTEGIAAE